MDKLGGARHAYPHKRPTRDSLEHAKAWTTNPTSLLIITIYILLLLHHVSEHYQKNKKADRHGKQASFLALFDNPNEVAYDYGRKERVIMDEVIRRIKVRLVISVIAFATLTISSWVTFYYLHTTAPIVPAILGYMACLPGAIMMMSLHDLRSIKTKKSQQPH